MERLAQHKQWVIKEPRLCLLAPVLRDYLPGAAYVHVWRHPLEVASSLKLRNGFPLHGSVALWELYNRHALEATRNVPRVVVAYRDLMRRPEETLNSLLEGLRLMGVPNLRAPKKDAVARLVDPVLYRHRAVETGYEQQLSPAQVELVQHMEEATPETGPDFIQLSQESRRYLVELEAAQLSFLEYVEEANVSRGLIRNKDRAIAQLEGAADRDKERVRQLEERLRRRDADIGERDKKIGKLEQRVEEEAKVNRELIRSKDGAIARLEGDVDREKEQVRQSQDTLEIERRRFEEYVEEVNVNRRLMEDRLADWTLILGSAMRQSRSWSSGLRKGPRRSGSGMRLLGSAMRQSGSWSSGLRKEPRRSGNGMRRSGCETRESREFSEPSVGKSRCRFACSGASGSE